MPPALIQAFRAAYMQLAQGATGYLPSVQLAPLHALPTLTELAPYRAAGERAIKRTVMIKLNGGLGTTMGMQGPKSLIPVKGGVSFLELILRQVEALRRRWHIELPLVLMNSFHTHRPTQDALKQYVGQSAASLTFVQHQVPKLWADDLTAAEWPADPSKAWCPPGHGDLYLALQTSGMLRNLLARGYEYAFISNVDNLGATLNMELLGYMVQSESRFLLEAAARQPKDCKGGHLAEQPGRGLVLRELAQCPPDELAEFQNIATYCYFNTNNLWVHLPTLKHLLDRTQGILGLPLIRNEKPIDPTQPESRRVIQVETALGHAISLFPNAGAIEVPRQRFVPVKTTNDLLALWSDAYVLGEDYTIHPNPARTLGDELVIDLDKNYYGLFHQLKARFPHHVPSLINCSQFRVRGNVYFDAALAVEGHCSIKSPGEGAVRWLTVPLRHNDVMPG
jgi:UTP--glucose-1-phosphate uridylyltransferase